MLSILEIFYVFITNSCLNRFRQKKEDLSITSTISIAGSCENVLSAINELSKKVHENNQSLAELKKIVEYNLFENALMKATLSQIVDTKNSPIRIIDLE